MPEIVITEFMDESAVEELRATHETLYDPKLVDQPEALSAALGEAKALIVRNRTQVRAPLLDAAPALACVGRLGVGLDNIDVDACKARGITVYPATGANDLAVAEYVITSALVLRRAAYGLGPRMRAGEWPRQHAMGRELSGATIGLVGFGSIAREVASRARALGMKVIAYDPFLKADDPAWSLAGSRTLDGLLDEADIVSLHTPLTDTTRHLIGADALKRMKKDAVLVNAARGGVLDEAALAAALKAGDLAGAALDVFETEPLDAEAGKLFQGIDNLILTPHIAGVTRESNSRVSALIAKKVREHLARDS